MRSWESHIDNRGLLTHSGDGGDTANREGLFAIAEVLCPTSPFRQISWDMRRAQLEISPGIYVRHPEGSRAVPSFWSNPNEFSRDQQIPLTVAMTLKQDWWARDRLFKAHSRRFFKCQNSDWLSPAIYMRCAQNGLLHALAWLPLIVFDLALLWNTFNRCGWVPQITDGKLKWLDEDDVGDDVNHTVMLLYARLYSPTPVSWLARKLYVWFRPYGGVQRAWDWYFREESGAPPLNELWSPIIKKWMS